MKTYNVYINFYKKDESGYSQKHIHTQIESDSEELAFKQVKAMFEVNNKGYKVGSSSVIKITTGFNKRDLISFGCFILNELGKLNVKDNITYFFDKWYSEYKISKNERTNL